MSGSEMRNGESTMRSNRLILLILALACLVSLVAGCGRSRTVANDEPAPGDAQAVEPVARGQAPKEGKDDEPTDKPGFRFPEDRGGVLLQKVLTPEVPRSTLQERVTAPRRTPTPPSLESPTLPLPPAVPIESRLPVGARKDTLQPRLTIEETLGGGHAPVLPQTTTFSTSDRVRISSVDVNQPPPLPILAQPVPDRASLDDATGDASAAAVLSGTMPERANPVPFQKLTIPDPFENRLPVQLKEIPAEDPQPVVASPKPPKP
jgi:hypothetical protein